MSGLPIWARPGVKVVCVDDSNQDDGRHDRKIVAGGIYVIRETMISNLGNPGVRLVGIAGSINRFSGRETGWHIHRFRPLVSIEDDLAAHFNHLLDIPASKDMEGV